MNGRGAAQAHMMQAEMQAQGEQPIPLGLDALAAARNLLAAHHRLQEHHYEQPANDNSNDATSAAAATACDADPSFECPRDASRMELTDTERQHALAIKRAVQEESSGLDPLADFDYVQLALVDGANVEAALERAHHIQIFREEYGISDTFQESLQMITRLVELMPEFMLTVAHNPDEGNYVLVLDIAKFEEDSLRSPQDMKAFLGGAYAMGHLLSPDFEAIRQGYYCVIECDGYHWRKLSMKTRRKLWQEILAVYPFTARKIKYFNSGLFANLAYSLMKKFLPIHVHSKMEVGCQFPGGRLDSFYAIPTREVANQKLLSRVAKCLKTRYHHQKSFRLTNGPLVEGTGNVQGPPPAPLII